MNKTSSTLCAALLLTGASSAFASSTELTVTGLITPSACSPSLSSGGIVDFGKIPAKDLNKTTSTQLPTTSLQLTVLCDGPTHFALAIKDQQQDSSPAPDTFYGLGKTPDAENIGRYLVRLKDAFADSAPANKIYSFDGGESWHFAPANPVPPLGLVGFGDQSSGEWAPIMITQLLTDLEVSAQINPAQDLTLNQEVPLTGKATIEIRY